MALYDFVARLAGGKRSATPDAGATTDVRTVTIRGCSSAIRSDGRVALVLDTMEVGPIAFVVDHETAKALAAEARTIESNFG